MRRPPDVRLWAAVLLMGLSACGAPPIPLDAPAGWTTDDHGRWWTAGTDTAAAFRDLSTLERMGVGTGSLVYDNDLAYALRQDIATNRMVRYVQQDLLPLFRNHPEIVDSLFVRYVIPDIVAAGAPDDPTERLGYWKREGYRKIARHFRDPRAVLMLGTDIPVPIPDSLRALAAGRSVTFQVRIDTEGRPVAMMQTEGVHPILDRIALRAVAAMRWQPAYLLTGSRSVPVASWARFGVRFPG